MVFARPLQAVVILMLLGVQLHGQGLALNGIGPINQSMGGAAVAAPIDAAGALHWNPASISGLVQPETSFGVTLAKPSEQLESSILFPFELSASDRGNPGVSPIPYAAFVDRSEGSRLTYGLGIFGIGGFRADYPSSLSNPILTPQPPNGVGVGRLFAEAQLLQVVPTLSWACSDCMSIGFAPTVSLGRIDANPIFLAAPDDADGDGFASFPRGGGSRYHWGGGFQLGWYYASQNHWHLGASLKSKQWFEQFEFQTENELGAPRVVRLDLEYPTILSIGAAYGGLEHVLVAADVRYFDYQNAEGLGTEGFREDGAIAGLGWDSILAVSLGTQFVLTNSCSARIGYTYNDNPVPSEQVTANAASPVITQHLINLGISKQVGDCWMISAAYTHGFENDVTGPINTEAGPIPGSRLTSIVSLDGVTVGVTVRH
jgi:long-chain fatty acid transport protein